MQMLSEVDAGCTLAFGEKNVFQVQLAIIHSCFKLGEFCISSFGTVRIVYVENVYASSMYVKQFELAF